VTANSARRWVAVCWVWVIIALVLLPAPEWAAGQMMPVGDPLEGYLRVLRTSGIGLSPSFTVRPVSLSGLDLADSGSPPSSDHRWSHPWGARIARAPVGRFQDGWWSVGDSRLRVFANTKFPRGRNDGVVWQGRGVTTALETSATLRWQGLSAVLNPILVHTRNVAFDLAPVTVPEQPEFAYPWRRMDYPQRFGAEAYWTLDAGESRIALDLGRATVSFGNERLWWGPGIRNAIVMSGNAPGFRHASLMTNRPLDIGIGQLEAQWVWGGLGSSEYHDPSAPNDRYLTGIVVAYSPDWLDGLTVGGTRVFQRYVPDGGLPLGEYFLVFQGLMKSGQISSTRPDGTDERDQLLSVFGRWVFAESGAEAYFEWARNDHSVDITDFLQEPEHSQGYTLGLQKVTSRSERRMVVLNAELTHLEASPTFQLRPRATYYEHSVVTQGYTHKGQILGAWVGPGGNSQYLGVETFERWGSASFFIQRQVHDNDAFWEWAEATGSSFDNHDVSLDIGVSGIVFRGDFEIGGGVTFTRELNRYFFGPKLNNVNLSLSARWGPGSGGDNRR